MFICKYQIPPIQDGELECFISMVRIDITGIQKPGKLKRTGRMILFHDTNSKERAEREEGGKVCMSKNVFQLNNVFQLII